MLIDNDRINGLTSNILAASIEVHRTLGPGLLESIYMECLQYEVSAGGLRFVAQKPIRMVYKSLQLRAAYRVDLIVEDTVVVEVKSVETILPVHSAQVVTYLRVTGCPAGLLINFHARTLMSGVKRLLHPLTGATATAKAHRNEQ